MRKKGNKNTRILRHSDGSLSCYSRRVPTRTTTQSKSIVFFVRHQSSENVNFNQKPYFSMIDDKKKTFSRILNIFCEVCAMYAIGKSKVHQRGDYDNGEIEKKAKQREFLTWWAIPRRRQINIKLARPPMKNGRTYHKI